MGAPPSVAELVARFERNKDNYRSAGYNETQVRLEFIDPLFDALGWDMHNRDGYAEAYKDVIHEDAIKIGGTTKAPDYCFRIGGRRIFFLEAKKPAVNIAADISPAYQLRRYAWSAKLPLSILTDFEELAVYDCRVKPDPADKVTTGRILLLKYTDYVDRWNELADTFSKQAVLKGSFDKYAETKRKRGTAEVDAAFLEDIEGWREQLAKNFAAQNPGLDTRALNFAVQRTIDRIIFLRMCEDRGIEPFEQLRGLQGGEACYRRLCEMFRRADERYNSGLFHFEPEPGRVEPPDELTMGLGLDDKPLKEIIRQLYYPESPYEFSVLPAEILGQVYEQFLGKVIRLTAGHRAVVEPKPEVKKAGGVYYTPAYIVEYIVRQTVGKLVEGKTPKEVSKLRVLDPACGSGSFLVGAYRFLLDWHRDWYVKDGTAKYTKEVFQGAGGQWYLTNAEKKRILLNNIYGVDIDPQAVEVTKLSLLLKVLEGENRELHERQLRILHERALPDLGSNIKCGNSLVAPDDRQMLLLDEERRYRINTFDWMSQFSKILQGKNGGFDAVIGNPPYIDSEWMTLYLPETRKYCVGRYTAASGNWDIFCVFAERAIRLCKLRGYSSFIVPNKLGAANYAAGVRQVLTIDNRLISIRDYSHTPVFPVAVYPIVYVVSRDKPDLQRDEVVYERMQVTDDGIIDCAWKNNLRYQQFFSRPESPWEIFNVGGGDVLRERLRGFRALESEARVVGAATVSEAYDIQTLIREGRTDPGRSIRLINSGTIDRYQELWGRKACRYLGQSFLRPVIPAANLRVLPPERLRQARSPKVIIAGMTKRLEAVADLDGSVLAGKSTTLVMSSLDPRLVLAILNSKLINYFYNIVFGGNKLAGGYLRIGPPQIKKIPIPSEEVLASTTGRETIDAVQRLLEMSRRSITATTEHQRTHSLRQFDTADQNIDRLVYELYGLTDDEIVLVEAATATNSEAEPAEATDGVDEE